MALALSIYPTLLDSFYWLKKIPSDEKIQDFIDKINKVQKPIPPAALKGVQLEGLINAKLDGLELLPVEGVYSSEDHTYSSEVVDKLYHKLQNCKSKQKYIQAIVPTDIGDVKYYGFVDYVYPEFLIDLKGTGKYVSGKFANNYQHKTYSLIEETNGTPINNFKYLVTDYKNVFVEKYIPKQRMYDDVVAETVELYGWLKENEKFITNQKIWGL